MATSNLEIIIGLKDQASGPLGGLRRALGGIGQIAGGILGAQAIGGIINGIKGMATEAFDAVSSYERLGASMEALAARELRAADDTLSMTDALALAAPKAQELLKWSEQLAINSPFDQEGVANALKTAMAYGFTAEEAQRLTEATIDFVAATGGTSAQMDQIALALGQIRAKGKVSGQEILQLTNAGVGVNAILEDMGFTLKDVEKGLVSSDDFMAAFTKTMNDDFGGAAERQAGTWAGLVSTLGDVKKIGLREFFSGVFKAVQPLVAKLSEWLQGPGLEILRGWGEQLGVIASKAVDFFMALASGNTEGALTQVFPPSVVANIMTGIGWLQQLGGWLQTNLPIAIQTVSAFWNNTLLPALQTAWAYFQNNILPVLADVWAWLAENVPVAIQTLSDFWNNTLLPALQAGEAFFRDNILPVLTDVRVWLEENIPVAIQVLSDFWNNTLLPALQAAWDFFSTYILPILQEVADIMSITLGLAITAMAGLWQNVLLPALKDIWTFVKDSLGPKLKWLNDSVITPLKNAINTGLIAALKWLLTKLQELRTALQNMKLPDWLTPGSPTPFELGLRGISDAMGNLNNISLPKLQGGLSGLSGVGITSGGISGSGGGAGSGLYIGNQNITIFNGSDIDEILEAVQAANSRSARVGSAGYAG